MSFHLNRCGSHHRHGNSQALFADGHGDVGLDAALDDNAGLRMDAGSAFVSAADFTRAFNSAANAHIDAFLGDGGDCVGHVGSDFGAADALAFLEVPCAAHA